MPVIRRVPNIATCRAEGVQNDTHTISDGALAWSEGRFEWIGPDKELPDRFREWDVVRAEGDLIVPGPSSIATPTSPSVVGGPMSSPNGRAGGPILRSRRQEAAS